MLGACSVHRRGFEQPVELPERFSASGGQDRGGAAAQGGDAAADATEADSRSARPPTRWWTTFADGELDDLVELALRGNFDLATFRARVRAARAVVQREASVLFPIFDYSLFGQQARRASDDFAPSGEFGAALIGSYQVDVWRQNASRVESAELRVEVTRQQLHAAAIALSADVAATWYALVEQRAQAAVLDQQITNNETVLEVVRKRFGGGVVRASDVLRQQRLLESTREQRAVVRARVAVLENALEVLLGRVPTGDPIAEVTELPALPRRPALGLPSELVARRPDVRSALLAVRAADAEVAVAVAAKYPSVTLGLEGSTVEEQIGDLFDDWTSLVAVDVFGPLFDGGRREGEVQRTEAVMDERVREYGRTILLALRQVEDAVARESALDEQIERIELQLELAGRVSERLNREYLNGDISYIDVLQAQTTEQRLQRDLLSARLRRIQNRIDLYVALAGGWPDDADTGTPEEATP